VKPPLEGTTFEVVDALGMSRLGDLLGSEACVRKALDRGSHLPKAPSALLGTVRHQILDSAVRGRWPPRGGTPLSDWGNIETTEGRQAVAAQLVEAAMSLMDARLHEKEPWRVPLKSAWEPIHWHNQVTRLRSLAIGLISPKTTNVASGDKPKIRRGLRVSEVELESKLLHLKGSADLVEWQASDVVRISDYKSGGVLDFDGNVKAGYVLQLQGYALAVEDSAEGAKPAGFELELLSDSGTTRVASDAHDLAALRARLLELDLPWGKSVTASPFETPGPHCAFCPQRPACASYVTFAEDAWKQERVGIGLRPLPLDTWGTLEEVEEVHGRLRLVLRSPNGQRTQVTGVGLRHFSAGPPARGQPVWLFDLQTQEGHKGGKYVHPLNFHEVGPKPWLSSWTTRVFLAPELGAANRRQRDRSFHPFDLDGQ
jgi:hypothetical protein